MEIRKRNGEMAAFDAGEDPCGHETGFYGDECGDHGAIAEQPFAAVLSDWKKCGN